MSNPQPSHLESTLYVSFFTEALEYKAESEKQGRPIFKDVAFVRIVVPGDVNNIIERKATKEDEMKFPRAWARYQAEEREAVDGMPLEQWPQITRSLLKELKYFEVHTVEQLAGLSDGQVSKLGMGFTEYRNKAKAFLEAASGTASQTAQAAENERLKQQMADLQAQIVALGSEKKRGRPAKEEVEA
jgi:hypothetical protein